MDRLDGLTQPIDDFFTPLLALYFSYDRPRYSFLVGLNGCWTMRSTETLTRAGIAEAISHQLGLSRYEALSMVAAILQHMSAALERGENVKISSFGIFLLNDKPERTGRNPKTGVEAQITPRRALTFRASPLLKSKIAEN